SKRTPALKKTAISALACRWRNACNRWQPSCSLDSVAPMGSAPGRNVVPGRSRVERCVGPGPAPEGSGPDRAAQDAALVENRLWETRPIDGRGTDSRVRQ